MMNGWGWKVKLLRRFTSWNHIADDSSVSFGIAINNNKQAKAKADIGCQSMVLYQSPKTEWDVRCHSMVLHQSPQKKTRNGIWNVEVNCQSVWT